ncbi:TetR/AcrR family transcriptional regulator [Corynebacterium sp. sy017]|nr:TetR/AcrR family transcriptional regulator [Corynebacterium sp. sy017]TSD91245.1 TetR/AcrR family transcriptional regulator [Corynebacterium sp. SY003]
MCTISSWTDCELHTVIHFYTLSLILHFVHFYTKFILVTNEPLSLRERKRQQTRQAIEEHATRLAIERGLNNVTVEDICQAAQISRRTLFNYVESKEAAIIGTPPRDIPAEEQEKFLSQPHSDLIATTMELYLDNTISAQFVDETTAAEILRRRKHIRRENPSLAHLSSANHHEFFSNLHELLTQYLTRYPEQRILTMHSVEHEANHIAKIAFYAVHLGFMEWIDSPKESFATLRRKCHHNLDSLSTLASERIK